MTNFAVRIVADAQVSRAVQQFGALQAQVASLNETLERTAIVANGVNAAGFQKMEKMVQQSSRTFRAAAASTGMWETEQIKIRAATDEYTKSLQRQKMSFMDLVRNQKVARAAYREQLKLQQMVVRALPGRQGGKQVLDLAIPTEVHKDLDTVANRIGFIREQVRSASTQMVNWGKNTQWAGRQLMVGFTMPVGAFAAATGVLAYQVDKELTRIQKVYDTTSNQVSNDIVDMSKVNAEMNNLRATSMNTALNAAKQYGAAAKETLDVQAELAATGKTGIELQKLTNEVVRIGTLGEMEYADALQATIALQSIFRQSTDEVTESFNYMNSIENATSLQLKDFSQAIPIAAAPVKAFGGDIQELGVLLTAMKENGFGAVESANALKASLQRLGRPSKQVSAEFQAITGQSIKELVDNSDNLTEVFMNINNATKNLKAAEKRDVFAGLFGSYQVSRMMALVDGMDKLEQGIGQVSTAAKIAEQDTTTWATAADREIKRLQESVSMQFKSAVETLKIELAEMGTPFLAIATQVVKGISGIMSAFNNLPEWAKYIIAAGAAFAALVGPVVMLTGLFANFAGNMLKFSVSLTGVLTRFQLLDKESAAAKIAAGLAAEGFATERTQAEMLTASLEKLTLAERNAALEAQRLRMATLQGQGMTYAQAYGSVNQGWMANTLPGIDPITKKNAQDVAAASERTRTAWKATGGGILIAGAGLAAMQSSSDGLVGDFGKMAMYAGLIAPALMSVPWKSMGTGIAGLAGRGRGGAGGIAGGLKSAVPNALRLVSTFARFAGPAGLIVSAVAGIAILHSKIDDTAESMAKLNDTASKWGEIFGYDALEPGTVIDPQTGEEIKTITDRVKQLNEAAPEVGSAIRDAFDEVGTSAERAAAETKAMNIAIRQGINVIQSGGSAMQAREAVQASLMAGIEDRATVNRIMKQVDLEIDFNVNKSVLNENLDQVMDQIQTAIDNKVSKGKSEAVWDFFTNGDEVSRGSKEAGIQAAKDFYSSFAGASATEQVALARGIQENFDSMRKNALMPLTRNKDAMGILSQYGIDANSTSQQIAKALFDLQTVYSENGQPSPDFKAMQEMGINFETINKSLSNINSRNDEFVKTFAQSAGFSEEVAGNLHSMDDFLQRFVAGYVDLRTAQNGYEAAVTSTAARMAQAGQTFTSEQRLQILNQFRVAAGLEKTGSLLDGFGPATQEWTGDTRNQKGAIDAVNQGLMTTQQLMNSISAQQITGLARDAMTSFQQGIADATADKYIGSLDAHMAAVENAGQARMDAYENRAERASEGLEAMQEKRRKRIENSYDMRIKKIQDVIDAEEKAGEVRQRLYEEEQKRIDRMNQSENANIDFNMALNEGNLDEAARIRNDMQSQAQSWALEDAGQTADAKQERRREQQEKRIKSIEKLREAEMERLQKLEDRERKGLQRRQERERAALQASIQANQEAERKKYEARKKYIEDSLEDFVNMVATSGDDLKKNVKTWNAEHKGLALETQGRYNTTADNINKYIVDSVTKAREALVNSNMWETGGEQIATKMLEGAFGLNMNQFKKWMVTGRWPQDKKKGGPSGWNPDDQRATPGIQHVGGWAGDYRSNSTARKGVARTTKGLHPTEHLAIQRDGEFTVNKDAAKRHGDLLERINSGKVGDTRRSNVPMGGAGTGFAGLMAGALAASIKTTMNNAMAVGSQQGAAASAANALSSASGMIGTFGNRNYSLPGVKPWVLEAAQYLGNKFNIATIGGVGQRSNYSEHPLGRALDFMVSDDRGTGLANEVVRLNQDLDAMYVIWRQKINSFDGRGWRPMEDRGSPTANHLDHVHVSFDATGDTGDLPSLVSRLGSAGPASMGPGGSHRPINVGASRGLHDSDTPFPGIDFAAPVGTPVYAVGNGTITQSYDIPGFESRNAVQNGYRSYGRVMVQRLDTGPSVLYAHLSSRGFNAGSKVTGGTVIGKSGNTGYSTGPHLHFGASTGNPYAFVPGMKTGGHTLSDGLAMLHKKETVLTAPLSQQLQSGIQNIANGGNTTYNFNVKAPNGSNYSLEQIARAIWDIAKREEARKPQRRTINN